MAKTNILIAGNFNLHGTGYQTIIEALSWQLLDRCNITILGLSNDGAEHRLPFKVIPTHYEWLPQHIFLIYKLLNIDWLLIFEDIPKLVAVLSNMARHDPKKFRSLRKVAVFPVESGPIDVTWADSLSALTDMRFTFTDFGMEHLRQRGILTNKLRVGVNPFWYRPLDTEMTKNIRAVVKDTPYVLTVADNQIRKNLPECIRAVGELNRILDRQVYHVLVTNLGGKDGWRFRSGMICERVGLQPERLIEIESTITKQDLKFLYSNALCLLTMPMAEGIGLTLYEAQACGCPVLVTENTGGAEAVKKGYTVESTPCLSSWIYPWGNVDWSFASYKDAAQKMALIVRDNLFDREPIMFQDWKEAADKLYTCLEAAEKSIPIVRD